jgi:rRNA maturation endonuclease Nob1
MLKKLKDRMTKARDSAENFAASMLSNKVTEEIQQERYNICTSCDKLYKPTDTCKVCGCFMKVKTWMPEQKCPINKWLAVETKKD